jgi:hypothetical protein
MVSAVVAAAAASCTDGVGPSERGIRLISGFGVQDTIDAQLPGALVVEVRDTLGHRPAAGTIVRFTGVQRGFAYEAYVQALTAQFPSTFATAETADDGRAGVIVQLGPLAGKARVVISVPTLSLVDTAEFVVLPGAAHHAFVTPADTILYVGKSYALRGGVVDRYGNPRPDATSWTSSDPGLTVTSAGVVTANAVGRYSISASAQIGSATGYVSVAPKLRLAAWQTYPESKIVSMELDGSDVKPLAPIIDGGVGAHPVWMPGGKAVAYTYYDGATQVMRTANEDGTIKAFSRRLRRL